jgi:hypothetical protein
MITRARLLLLGVALGSAPLALAGPDDAGVQLAEPVPLKGIEYDGNLGPDLVDLDGDGTLDLVAGTYEGVFHVYSNEGEPTAPRFVAAGTVQSNGEDVTLPHW